MQCLTQAYRGKHRIVLLGKCWSWPQRKRDTFTFCSLCRRRRWHKHCQSAATHAFVIDIERHSRIIRKHIAFMHMHTYLYMYYNVMNVCAGPNCVATESTAPQRDDNDACWSTENDRRGSSSTTSRALTELPLQLHTKQHNTAECGHCVHTPYTQTHRTGGRTERQTTRWRQHRRRRRSFWTNERHHQAHTYRQQLFLFSTIVGVGASVGHAHVQHTQTHTTHRAPYPTNRYYKPASHTVIALYAHDSLLVIM